MSNTTIAKLAEDRNAKHAVWLSRYNEREAISLAIKEVEQSWKAGNDDIPATKLTELKAEEQRMESLVAAAEQSYKLAERNVFRKASRLAETIAVKLGDALYGIPARPATSIPSGPHNTPSVYVVEKNTVRHDQHASGALKGSVDVVVTGPSWMAPFSGLDVWNRLQSKGVYVEGTFHASKDVRQVPNGFALTIGVHYVIPELPRISAPVCAPYNITAHGAAIDEHFTGQTSIRCMEANADKVSESVDKHGIRTLKIVTTYAVRPGKESILDMNDAGRYVANWLEASSYFGSGRESVGSIVDSKVTHTVTRQTAPNGNYGAAYAEIRHEQTYVASTEPVWKLPADVVAKYTTSLKAPVVSIQD